MAGGKRYRWHGSTVAVLTDFGADSPSDAITGITRADPPVVTSTGHGRADGDVISITNVLGMTEANGVFIINVTGANTYELFDTDSTAWGTYTSGGRVNVGEFSNFCELTGYNRAGVAAPDIPATSLCSTQEETEVGLPGPGSTSMDYHFAPETAIQIALEAFQESGGMMAVKIVLPNAGGTLVQLGTVQQQSEQAGNGGLWSGSLGIRNTGRRYRVPA